MRKKKLVLDVIMICITATLYSKNIISLAYHEIVGLILCLLLLLHLAFNRKWISAVSKNLRNLNTKTKINAVTDILLFVSWAVVMVTGILISKKLFNFGFSGIWIRLHFFSGAVALILTGIHLALHRNFFAGLFNKKFAAVVMIALTLAGFYGVTRINLGTWLAAPFKSERPHRQEGAEGRGGKRRPHGEEPFDAKKMFDAVFGTISVLLVVNAGEYVVERIIASKKKRA